MSFFRKTSHLGATILGATMGGVGIPLVMSISPLSVSASDGNAADKDPRAQACKDDAIPLVAREDLELKFVQIFFRHGARTPIGTGCIPNVEEGVWDKDTIFQGAADLCIDYKVCALNGEPQPEWKIENYYRKEPLQGGAFKGQLTAVGMKQANDLGKKLRRHYMEKLGFLPQEFSPQLVYTRSTNINRTLQSLGCLMGGLYGNIIASKESVPVQFYTDEGLGEVLYPNRQRCNQLSHFYSSVLKGMFSVPGIGHGTDQIAPLLDASEEQKKKLDFVSMRDDITARLEHNMKVPDHLMPVIDLIEKHAVALMRFLIEGGNEPGKNIIKFSAGPTMHYICETLEAAKKKETPYKLHLNSCHDTTLMTLLLALEAFDDVWPPLTASVIFELYEDKAGNSFVRTLYQNKELRIRQSEETLLPLEKFKELLAPVSYTAQDYADACKVAS
ncbi:lysophosphatidic acid phosphatase type 6 isoform X1 [Strongylocentrotus purpuratus]|uniref:Acid phosphatase n=1 Tax=Strongylocentrotus purpuratus TaxID=7668 RepID=A0A7M7HNK4_STRPU|nr:lysophosphatidic acid phosphatase type 6 isoform X1 [Strongylocentrotus purpuratus]